MREIRPSGSVRGVRRKPYPYRDTPPADAEGSAVFRDAGPWLISTASGLCKAHLELVSAAKVTTLPDQVTGKPAKLK